MSAVYQRGVTVPLTVGPSDARFRGFSGRSAWFAEVDAHPRIERRTACPWGWLSGARGG
jgi:hypothetical protein